MEKNIRHGLVSQQFVAYYQPIVTISDKQIVGYEALVRWVLPDGEIMPPDDFLPIAEKTTLIADIDKQVLEQSIVKLSETSDIYISVNVSANSLSSGQYGQIVLDLLAKYDVDPKRLHIEFTETLLLQKIPVAEKTMTTLANVGIQWYVDDFGTGYSSISHLHDQC
jgi:EAL domain-containing protein (putative c-di-GMP-specific phosphodiesterase class I)